MRKLFFVFYLLFTGLIVYAQSMQVRLQETDQIKFNAPKLLAYTGNQYQLIDIVEGGEVVLFKIDSGFSKIESRLNLPVQAYNNFLGGTNDTALAIWRQEFSDSIVIHLLESARGAGNEQIKRWAISKSKHTDLAYVVNDVNSRFFFFYAAYSDTLGRIVLNGVLLDRFSKQIQSVAWPIDYDPEQQRLKPPVVDGYGNMHMVVYDKLTNHKLSVNVQVSTRNAVDQSTIVETFSFDKIKLYDLDFFDNPVAGEVQLRGFYYAGDSKVKTGLAAVGFPYKRDNKLSRKFTPMPEWQKLFLVEGVGAYNKRFEPLDYFKTTGYEHQSGSSVISGWVLDMPYKNFAKDKEQENLINTLPSAWIVPKKENAEPKKAVNPSQRNDQLKQQQSNNMLSETGQFRFGLARVNSTNGIVPPTINDARSRLSSDLPDEMIGSPLVKIGKIAFIATNENGTYDWIQVMPADFPLKTTQQISRLLGNSIIYKNTIYAVVPVVNEEEKRLKLLQIGKSGVNELLLDRSIPVNAIYTAPQKLAEGHFISLYKDEINRKSGILHLKAN